MELLVIAALVFIGLVAFFTVGSFLIVLMALLIVFEILPWWLGLAVIAIYLLRPSERNDCT